MGDNSIPPPEPDQPREGPGAPGREKMAGVVSSRSGLAHGRVLLAGLLLGATPAWAGGTERVSVSSNGRQANGDSAHPALSADGHFVAFSSAASNLARGAEGAHGDGRHPS